MVGGPYSLKIYAPYFYKKTFRMIIFPIYSIFSQIHLKGQYLFKNRMIARKDLISINYETINNDTSWIYFVNIMNLSVKYSDLLVR